MPFVTPSGFVLPPGPVFLVRVLPGLLLPAVCAFVGLRYYALVPIWQAAVGFVVTLIATPFVKALHKTISNKRAAARLGAVLPPVIRSAPGGFDLSAQIRNSTRSGYLGDVFARWSEEYGNTYVLSFVNETRIFTTEPVHLKAVLATQFNDFDKGPQLFEMFYSLLGRGVFNSDGDIWKYHRSMTRPFFNKERISHFDNFERHAENTLSQIRTRLRQGYPVDFQDAVSRFSLDSATEYLFGFDAKSSKADLVYPESSPLANSQEFLNHSSIKFVKAFASGQHWLALRTRGGPLWRLYEFWGDAVTPYRLAVDEFVNQFLDDALAKKAADSKAGVGKTDDDSLLHYLVEHTDDRTILNDEMINLLVAGRDTTTSLLTFSVYHICEYPHIAKRLRDEIMEHIGLSKRPDYDDIRNMKYMRAFLQEVLRLYPSVPINSRTANKATTLPSADPSKPPVFVPDGARIGYSVFLMHRRTDLWGPDANTFDPDRFLDERLHKYLIPNPFIFLPFNAGPRICLGMQFAYNEASFFLVKLLQQFSDFTFAPDAQPLWSLAPPSWAKEPGTKGRDKIRMDNGLTMSLRGGLWIRMKEIEASQLS
ncbi:cytochrome P450 [Fistulina hepatica ATCC 64428]|uniref:Cytochrome P450 n=1 Tax=Fistulina hepatica ATCC 64428 TaxID=1128425 RepID=A0A0D7AEE5_9AGAR|nr:cytochrome P450 [Fistulina hepatica ATCC 64428]